MCCYLYGVIVVAACHISRPYHQPLIPPDPMKLGLVMMTLVPVDCVSYGP